MTAKSTARKTTAKKRAPSAPELKRQIATERARADAAVEAANAQTEKVTALENGMAAMAEALNSLNSKLDSQTAPGAKALQDEANQRLSDQVLGEDSFESSLPEKPVNHIPSRLKRAVAAMEKRSMAINNPVTRGEYTESGDIGIGQMEERAIRSTGPASEAVGEERAVDEAIIIENQKYTPEKIEHEMFMHEQVCVMMHETTDDIAIPIPEVSNDGRIQHFVRGRNQWVKRWALEPLMRAKRTTYTQRKERDANGDPTYIMVPHTQLMYPFTIVEDTPKGREWVRRTIAEAN